MLLNWGGLLLGQTGVWPGRNQPPTEESETQPSEHKRSHYRAAKGETHAGSSRAAGPRRRGRGPPCGRSCGQRRRQRAR